PWRSSSLGGIAESNNVSIEGLMRFVASGTSSPPISACADRHRPTTGYDRVASTARRPSSSKIPIDVKKMGIGLISLRKLAHPVICRHFRARVEPQMSCCGQERIIRSGTIITPLAVGMGTAC
ncbi:unnamed protein product, partial [Musa textilis]